MKDISLFCGIYSTIAFRLLVMSAIVSCPLPARPLVRIPPPSAMQDQDRTYSPPPSLQQDLNNMNPPRRARTGCTLPQAGPGQDIPSPPLWTESHTGENITFPLMRTWSPKKWGTLIFSVLPLVPLLLDFRWCLFRVSKSSSVPFLTSMFTRLALMDSSEFPLGVAVWPPAHLSTYFYKRHIWFEKIKKFERYWGSLSLNMTHNESG